MGLKGAGLGRCHISVARFLFEDCWCNDRNFWLWVTVGRGGCGHSPDVTVGPGRPDFTRLLVTAVFAYDIAV